MNNPNAKILAFAGSNRSASYNRKLLQYAVEGARSVGATVTLIDLKDFSLPLYDAELEEGEGLPENAQKLQELFLQHSGLLIASPEYNASISPLLKNTLDWVSRGTKAQPTLACFRGKVAGILSASPSGLGGTRGLPELRRILSAVNTIVIPEQTSVAKAHEAFNESGELIDAKQIESAKKVGQRLAQVSAAISAS